MDNPTPQPSTAGSFFSLPAEVRNTIYTYAATPNPPIDTTSKPPSRRPSDPSSTALQPSRSALSHTCRQLYREFSALFYTYSVFKLRNADLQPFIHDIPAIHIQSIQELILDRRDAHWQGIMSLANPHSLAPLASFHGLERLRITGLAEPICWSQQFVELARLIEAVEVEEPFAGLMRAVRPLRNLRVVEIFSKVEEEEVAFLLQSPAEMGPWRWAGWRYRLEHVPPAWRLDAGREGVEGNILETVVRR